VVSGREKRGKQHENVTDITDMFFHLRVGDLLEVERERLASLIGIVEATVKFFFYPLKFGVRDEEYGKRACLDGLTTQITRYV
jgi:hypothetical protein